MKMSTESVTVNMETFAYKFKQRLPAVSWYLQLSFDLANITLHNISEQQHSIANVFFQRSGRSHYAAAVRPLTETVDLTGEDCRQLPDVVHEDNIDSGKKTMNNLCLPSFHSFMIT